MKIRYLIALASAVVYSAVTFASTTFYDLDVYRSFHKKEEDNIQGYPLEKS